MTLPTNTSKILAFATQGTGGDDETRLRILLSNMPAEFFAFDRNKKLASGRRLLRQIIRQRPDLVVMEGSGIAGGLAVLWGRIFRRLPYVISSGDAIGPFVGTHRPMLGPLFGIYERWLYRWCAGFIGWSPYLVGRALSSGAPRGMTAPGWAPFVPESAALDNARRRIRRSLHIADSTVVFGIAGSLTLNKRVNYCYGMELVRAAAGVEQADIAVLIVGDGAGKATMETLAGDKLNKSIFLPGRVPRDQVPDMLAAMDVVSLPQSLDLVGTLRYTTKISEYMAVRKPVVTGRIPLAYDLDEGWLWRLPGSAPWDSVYIAALSRLMETISMEEILAKTRAIPNADILFNRAAQVDRVTNFLNEILADLKST